MRTALLIAGKDLRQRLRDRSAIMVAVVVPLALAAIFGATLRDAGSGRASFPYVLVQQDSGAAAQAFVRVLRGAQAGGLARLRLEPTVARARHDVDAGSAAAAFVVPPGYSAAVEAGEPARLTVIGNLDKPIGVLVARSLAGGFAGQLDGVRLAVATAVRAGARGTLASLGRRAAALARPVVVDDVTASSRELGSTTFYAAGMAVFFLFFGVQFGVSSLLDERRQGTLARLLAAPVRRASVLGGKVLTSIAIGVASMAVLVVATRLLLGARWGNPVGVALLVGCGVVAATAVMALVTTLARTPDQAGTWQSIVAVVLGMLGGSFFPVANAGGLVEALSLATPHAWFMRGLQDLTGGAGPGAVLPSCGAMLAFAAVTGSLALLRVNRLAAR